MPVKIPDSKRITADQPNKDWVSVVPFKPVYDSKTYWQVTVGSYGVNLPKTLNMETLNGLQLVDDIASAIYDRSLAEKVAKKTGGKLLEVTETFKREIEEK